MAEAYLAGHVWLPKSELGSQIYGLRERLTVHPRSTSPFNPEPDPILLYEDRDDFLGVPREYFWKHESGKSTIVDKRSKGTPVDYGPPIKLWEHQIGPVAKVVHEFKEGHRLGGMLSAPPGSGKTVMSLEIIRRLGTTVAVLCHKEFLVNQWKERIEQFLPNARVGIVRQKICQYKDKDIIVCMMQSLTSREYPDELYTFPGLVIIDEVHRASAPTFCKASPQFSPMWVFGVSATIRRKDGTEPVFESHIGPIIAKADAVMMPPDIKRIKTGLVIPESEKFDPNQAQQATIDRILTGNGKRNGLIVSTIVQAARADRKIIVFSALRKHLLRLSLALKKVVPSVTQDYYVGQWYKQEALAKGQEKLVKRTQADLDRAAKAQIILCTYQMAKEGLDIPEVDCVVFASPQSDVEQAVGRGLRYHPDKKNPIVVDFIDECTGRLRRMASSRLKTYQKLGARNITKR